MSHIEKSIEVNVPVSTAYNQWTQFEDFPRFMDGINQVTQQDDHRLHWRATVGGKQKEWDAEIVDQVPDQRVSWRNITGAENAGAVTFNPIDSTRTRVTLRLDYDPDGFVEHVGDALGFVSRQVDGDLARFREFIETRGAETGAWRGEIHNPGAASTVEHEHAERSGLRGVPLAGLPAAAVGVAAGAATGAMSQGHATAQNTSQEVSSISEESTPSYSSKGERSMPDTANRGTTESSINRESLGSGNEGEFESSWSATGMPDGAQPGPGADRGLSDDAYNATLAAENTEGMTSEEYAPSNTPGLERADATGVDNSRDSTAVRAGAARTVPEETNAGK